MQQPAPTPPSPTVSSFAGLLATLAAPPPEAAENELLWNTSDLGEDVATLSYERALRAHARYRPLNHDVDRGPDRGDRSPILPAGLRMDASADSSVEADAAAAAAETDAAPKWPKGIAPDRDLRSASVTIRMSKAECTRLHRRAAEAGLTVSAYLRSCALEAEALRAQVKQALAELKAGSIGTAVTKGAPPLGVRAAPPLRDPGSEQESKETGWRKFFGWIARFTRRGR
jgi:hypothetical protein